MSLEAEVSYLYLIDGVRQTDTPANFAVRAAPRRCARGRDHDLALLALHLTPATPAELIDLAANAYFGTPGSVTAAARAAFAAVNTRLIELNRTQKPGATLSGGLCLAVLRGADLYIAQAGPGEAIVLHPNIVERFPESNTLPLLGLSQSLDVQYFHTALAASDYLLLSSALPSGWQAATMTNLPNIGLESAVARLTRAAGSSAHTLAMIIRFVAEGAAQTKGRAAIIAAPIRPPAPLPEPPAPAPDPVDPERQLDNSSLAGIIARVRASSSMGDTDMAADSPPTTELPPRPEVAAVTPPPAPASAGGSETLPDNAAPVLIGDHVYEFEEDEEAVEQETETVAAKEGRAFGARVRAGIANARAAVAEWFANLPLNNADEWMKDKSESLGKSVSGSGNAALRRLLPEGLLSPDTQLRIPNSVLIAIAVLLPVIIGLFVGVVYVQRGRDQQFKDYMASARLEAGLARTAPDPLAARPHWETVIAWLDQADAIYPGQPDSAALRAEAQQAVDALENIQRLLFEPLVPGGFSPTAKLTGLVVNGSEVYALDSAHQIIYRALLTESNKFTIDRGFQCEGGAVGSFVIDHIVDIAWLNTPNVVGQEALLALDDDGVLMYCKPDGTPPEASQLIPPDSGFKSPRAIEIYAGRLYIFDPGANEIWLYDRPGGVFSERPKGYFTGGTPDLSTAASFTIAQGDVYILRADGRLTFCARDPNTLQSNCVENALFTDTRTGHASGERLDDVGTASQLFYDPPPEPSLYLFDVSSGAAYQLSLKLVLQRQYRSAASLPDQVSALAIGANKETFVAAGNNVYWAKR